MMITVIATCLWLKSRNTVNVVDSTWVCCMMW